MLNIISFVIGFVALILAIPSFLPLLGWGNWLVVPLALVGVAIGAASHRRSGRNFNLIVVAIGIARLSLGGGFI